MFEKILLGLAQYEKSTFFNCAMALRTEKVKFTYIHFELILYLKAANKSLFGYDFDVA